MADRRITDEELRGIITDTVHATFTELGVDANNPLEMQRDFQFMRRWRQSTEALGKGGMVTLFGLLLTGICTALWLGLKAVIMKP